MTAVADPTGLLAIAPDGTPLPHPMLVTRPHGVTALTCSNCGRATSFVNATAQRVQWFATSHRCGGPTWQG